MDEPRKKKDSRMPLTRKNKDAIAMADRAEKMMSARHEEFTKEDVPSTPKIAETAEGIIKVSKWTYAKMLRRGGRPTSKSMHVPGMKVDQC